MKNKPHTPYDTFLKTLLELAAHTEALVRLIFRLGTGKWPAEVPFERLPAELFGPELTPLVADALFLVRDGDNPDRDCIVGLEHKSGPDTGVAWQIIRYTGAVLNAQRTRVRKKDGGSPRILFSILYHGSQSWNPALPKIVLEPVRNGKPLTVMDCVFVDLKELDLSLLADWPILREGLGLMAMSGTDPPARERLVSALRAVAKDEVYKDRFLSYMVYALKVAGTEIAAAYIEAIPEDIGKLEGKMETLANQWMAEGRAEGRAEGERRGELKGLAKALVRQLGRRFGTVPVSARKRIAAASDAELGAWLDAILDANSVDAVFAASPRS